LIAEAFYLTGDIEKYGSGFVRIRKEIKEYPTMKMEFGEIQSGFLFTMSYTKQKTSLVENDVGVNVGVNAILMLIENNPGMNVLTMAKDFKVTQRTIERWINRKEFLDALRRGFR
jgi:ATP-dependent DNA helicase RecG